MKAKFLKPHIVVTISVIVTASLISVGSYFLSRWQRPVEVAVEYVDSPAKAVLQDTAIKQKVNAMQPDGEVYHIAMQVREASAILMGATLVNVQRRMSGIVPGTVGEAVGVVPVPNVILNRGNGIFESNEALYYVRYRITPIGFEVVAQPKNDAPRFILRMDPRTGLQYFEATKIGEVEVPAPFAGAATFVGKGWTLRLLKTEDGMKPEEKEQLLKWAALAAKGGE